MKPEFNQSMGQDVGSKLTDSNQKWPIFQKKTSDWKNIEREVQLKVMKNVRAMNWLIHSEAMARSDDWLCYHNKENGVGLEIIATIFSEFN